MALIIRPALASDAQSIGNLARQFASYLSELGDLTDFKLTANAYLRNGFGTKPAFAGLVAEDQGKVIGYLLYHFGYDSDRAARNMHVVDLYVDRAARNQGVGKALMARAASIAREASAEEIIWSGLPIKYYCHHILRKAGGAADHRCFLYEIERRQDLTARRKRLRYRNSDQADASPARRTAAIRTVAIAV